ncbi:hypothetical protein BSKO_11784 [Bryopsis sp. KO-2023]|nr:hypothetical protein BSKO_11784 [Bryopsis sp. KO-2023]
MIRANRNSGILSAMQHPRIWATWNFSKSGLRMFCCRVPFRPPIHIQWAPQRQILRGERLFAVSLGEPPSCGTALKIVPESPFAGEWPDLNHWRQAPIDEKRGWGNTGPSDNIPPPPCSEEFLPDLQSLPGSLAECGALVLNTGDPMRKAAISHMAWTAVRQGRLVSIGTAGAPPRPARPPKPELVPMPKVPKIADSPLPKSVYMLHNLAHIELNAIDLAWDTLVRFSHLGLEDSFYTDFAHVADDESRHFGWCVQRLSELGHAYGDMAAHDMLWASATQSTCDLSSRLALVPMSQEARGLDAGPRLCQRLQGGGDARSAGIVGRIAQEEKAHVGVGVSWFLRVSHMLDLQPDEVYKGWLEHISPELLKGPFNHGSRNEVGFRREWYDKGMWREGRMGLSELQQLSTRLKEVLDVEIENSECE